MDSYSRQAVAIEPIGKGGERKPMEMKNIRRLLALCLAVVMIIASSMAVMAADNKSPGGGDVDPDPVITSRSSVVNGWNGKTTIKYTGKNAVKYQIQYKAAQNTGWVTRYTTDLSYALTLKHNGLYDIRVRAIGKNGKTSAWSTMQYRYVKAVKPTYSTATTKTIRVKTPKTSGVTGYAIYYSTNKNMTNAKKIVVKKNYTNKPISVVKGKTYYIKVVPFVQKNGKTYWGAGSSVTAVKAK